MISLRRKRLAAQLEEMAQAGSLLVVGGPGAGKSWLLQQFAETHQKAGDAVLLLLADEYNYVESLRQLDESLGISTGIIPTLKAYAATSRFLVIDSLDSLRAEASQRVFRELIRRVHRELPEWKVIASIRSFDLQESVELQRLFLRTASETTPTQHSMPRHLMVPVFDDSELAEAIEQDTRLQTVFSSASVELREILRNAFNLWLVTHLLDEKADIDWLFQIESEVQLLERYWQYRISRRSDSPDRFRILSDVTSQMVTSRTLSVPLADAYKNPGAPEVLQSLLSDEVLRKTFTQRIAYVHNILFDFAVAKLLLDEQRFFPFLKDPARSIFFRPSVAYFLVLLWHGDRNLFWGVVSDFFKQQADLPTRLSVIPGMAVFEAATKTDDLEPLLDPSRNLDPGAVLSVLRSVQAFDGFASRRARLWLNLVVELSNQLHIRFLNEFLALLESASRRDFWTQAERKLLAAASIRFLHWMWQLAESNPSESNAEQLLSIAAGRVIPLVLGFFPDEPDKVRGVLNQILERIGRPDVSASEAYAVARCLETIVLTDPLSAVAVYTATFSHHEKSQRTTSIGGGKVLGLRSTRAQDYSMAYFILDQKFHSFLANDVRNATIAAIRAVSAEVKREHARVARKIGQYSARFQLFSLRLRLVSDRSEIWDQTSHRDTSSLDLLQRLLSHLMDGRKHSTLSATDTWDVFKLIASENPYPVVWKRILQYATRHAELVPFALPLLQIPEILIAPETTVVAGDLITQSYATLTPADREAIEKAIWKISKTSIAKLYRDPTKERDRLLACIPDEERSEPSRQAVEKARSEQSLRANRPLVEIGPASFRPLADDYWLKQQGIDPNTQPNRAFLERRSTIASFTAKYINQTPSLADIDAILPPLQQAFDLVRSAEAADQAVRTDLFTAVAAAAHAILRNGTLDRETTAVRLSRAIVAEAAVYPFPQPSAKADAQFDRAMWSPTPSIEAAQAIIYLAQNWNLDPDIENLLRTLSGSKSPGVRFQIAAGLGSLYTRSTQLFWEIADSMLSTEKATGVFEGLIRTIGQAFIAQRDPVAVVNRLAQVVKRGLPKQRRSEVFQVLVDSLSQLYVYLNNDAADFVLRGFEKSPLRYPQPLHSMAWSASFYLTYKIESTDAPAREIRSRAQQMELRVLSAIDRGFHQLEEQASKRNARKRTETVNQLLLAVDRLALRLHILAKELAQVKLREEQALSVFLRESSPLWDALVSDGTTYRRPMAPSTAHQLMESFNLLLPFDPPGILRRVARLITGRTFGYHFDELAIGEFVKFAEKLLADHKETLRDPVNAVHFGEVLDVFVSAGWPAATQIVTRLDAAVR